jgi:hypothetical protein
MLYVGLDILANGKPLLGVQALSFEVPVGRDLSKDVHATAFSITDVRKKVATIPLTVVTPPPPGKKNQYSRIVHMFKELGAEVVQERDLSDWAVRMAARVHV